MMQVVSSAIDVHESAVLHHLTAPGALSASSGPEQTRLTRVSLTADKAPNHGLPQFVNPREFDGFKSQQ